MVHKAQLETIGTFVDGVVPEYFFACPPLDKKVPGNRYGYVEASIGHLQEVHPKRTWAGPQRVYHVRSLREISGPGVPGMDRSTDQTKRDNGQEEHKTNRKPANRELQDLWGKLNQGRTESSNDAGQGTERRRFPSARAREASLTKLSGKPDALKERGKIGEITVAHIDGEFREQF
ncbi:hypothetical protein B0H10DRAFT_2198902 [Mycena sp. CBHHK59/15]|nr:hypothetical protein B0H10DRAFT_2198902 [Mycena sp. CBHHK59/15]